MIKNQLAIMRFMNSTHGLSRWRPAVDIYRYNNGWLVKCELAGVSERDIQLEVVGNRLTVSGCRRDLLVREGHTSHSMEIAYNCFERLIDMPGNIETAALSTIYQDGMLLIYLQVEDGL